MEEKELLSETEVRMEKALEVLKEDLATIRTGRATPSLIENLKISCYGGSQNLKLLELASITAQDSRTLLLTPFDPAVIEEIEKGILESDLGLTPQVEGKIIRVKIPALSGERREEFLSLAKKKLEGGRIMIRQIRKEARMELRKAFENEELNEDERDYWEEKIQDLTDQFNRKIEMLGKQKEAELKI